jgi:hypothetical protein
MGDPPVRAQQDPAAGPRAYIAKAGASHQDQQARLIIRPGQEHMIVYPTGMKYKGGVLKELPIRHGVGVIEYMGATSEPAVWHDDVLLKPLRFVLSHQRQVSACVEHSHLGAIVILLPNNDIIQGRMETGFTGETAEYIPAGAHAPFSFRWAGIRANTLEGLVDESIQAAQREAAAQAIDILP